MSEGYPIKPGTPAAEMVAAYDRDMQDPELPMRDRIDAADNYRHMTGTFEPQTAIDPETGVEYLSRGSDGILYSGPDCPGFYDF